MLLSWDLMKILPFAFLFCGDNDSTTHNTMWACQGAVVFMSLHCNVFFATGISFIVLDVVIFCHEANVPLLSPHVHALYKIYVTV